MMLWQEIIVDYYRSSDEIATALSKLFSVPATEVLVVEDIADAPVSEHFQILCERMPVKGDFLMKLSIYLLRPELEQRTNQSLIDKFCGLLHCKCLISDGSFNPFSMMLVQGSGNQQLLHLDVERLEENEEYAIAKSVSSEGKSESIS